MKPSLICIPGMMCTEALWKEQFNSNLQEKFTFVKPQMKHFCKDTIEEIASQILSSIKEKSVYALGLSMGGIIIMEMLKQAPQKFCGVIFADTNYKAEIEQRKKQRILDIEEIQTHGLKKFVVEKMKPKYLSPSLKDTRNIYKLITDMALNLGDNFFINQSLALKARKDYSATLQQIKCRCLILCGEDDVLCSIETHQEMQQLIKNSYLKIIKKAGHLSCLEQPDQFNQQILKFYHQYSL